MSETKRESDGAKRRRLGDDDISELASSTASLLSLSDDVDGPLLSKVLSFLTAPDVGRCERVCKTLRRHARLDWEVKSQSIPTSCRSKSAGTAKEVVAKFHLASKLAVNIDYPREGVCNCGDPEFRDLNSKDVELFVRLKDPSRVFYEGFVSFNGELDDIVTMTFAGKDVSSCYRMGDVIRSIEGGKINDKNSLRLCMTSLSVSVVIVNKPELSGVKLLYSVNSFKLDETNWRNTNCWAKDLKSFGDEYAFLIKMTMNKDDTRDGDMPNFTWELKSMYCNKRGR